MAVQPTRRRFTVDEYYWMARVGILGEDDRVELRDGEIVEMPPIGPEHASTVDDVSCNFVRSFSDLARVRVKNPIRLDRFNEPEPDVALVTRRKDGYRAAHPTPEDVFLVVEVSDTTLAEDLRRKVPLYATYRVPEVWVIDVNQQAIRVYRDPVDDSFRLVQALRRGESLAPLAFPDRQLSVDDLLG